MSKKPFTVMWRVLGSQNSKNERNRSKKGESVHTAWINNRRKYKVREKSLLCNRKSLTLTLFRYLLNYLNLLLEYASQNLDGQVCKDDLDVESDGCWYYCVFTPNARKRGGESSQKNYCCALFWWSRTFFSTYLLRAPFITYGKRYPFPHSRVLFET